jgi:hypothetical protein
MEEMEQRNLSTTLKQKKHDFMRALDDTATKLESYIENL